MEDFSEIDPNSFSNPNSCKVEHLHLDLNVNFDSCTLSGQVDVTLSKKQLIAKTVILDTQCLTIRSVKDKATQKSLNYTVGSPIQVFGSKLEINLPETNEKKFIITIEYETSPKAGSLQWLQPSQTAGKLFPYLFSQCEAIYARSMVPCQDTPFVKSTYSATIHVPADLTVLMSGIKNEEKVSQDLKTRSVSFVQKIPIPSYLIAIAVGALESRKIGPRSHVWAEKEYIDKAAYEFAETESMLKVAEDLLGPYVWGIYDLLVLPPSFPMGGMENPCLTFVTPTLLAGDRSLTNVIAHEISHSWTGNLVTNKNFEHFWLNEGFTVFVERKICGRMCGESARQFNAITGWKSLEYDIEVKGKDNPLTKLVVDLKCVDPDDAFSRVPYEKGHSLLFYLEQLLGGPDVFDPFLKAYIQKFIYKSIDTDEWKSYLYEYFKNKKDILDTVDWDAWLYSPGMPPLKLDYDTTLQEKCVSLCKTWVNTTDDFSKFTKADIEDISSDQIIQFLTLLLDEEPLSEKKMVKLTEIYNFENIFNLEIRFRWLRLGLLAHWQPIIPHVVKVISEIGRMKFVVPLYRDLLKWKEMETVAVTTFKKQKNEMMHITSHAVNQVMEEMLHTCT